jgi:hypothetical protein
VRLLSLVTFTLLFCAQLVYSLEKNWPTVTKEMKPWTRWWWHGNAVEKEEIKRHLELFKKAGIGGVEITSIYGVEGEEKKFIKYLSPHYMDILKYTAQTAQSLGMGVDLPTGAGWRCGGPQTSIENADSRVIIEKFDVPFGTKFKQSFKSRPQLLTAISDYGDKFDLLKDIDWLGNITWYSPGGDWTVYSVSQKWSGAKVKRPSIGGEGYSFNPYSKKSFNEMIMPFQQAFSPFPKGLVRSQFHDSFEYSGNWMDTLFDEFEKRRGYDLKEHIPELLGEGNHTDIGRIKCDYRETISDLVLENFILPWVEWSHSIGQLARNQSHGSPGNLLDIYGAVDIPETEIFRFDNHIDVLKFASSAGNVLGRQLVSSESFTWQDEHFHVTLDTMKRSTDKLFAAGINHIFFHGTTYSPQKTQWPGWLFYASSQINPQNTIWTDLPAYNKYVARCQSILQTSKPDNDVLVYWPVYDVWSNPDGFEQKLAVHNNQWITKNPAGDVAGLLRENGYLYDFVSDWQLKGTRVKDGRLKTPGSSYDCLIVPHCQFMPLETFETLKELAENGAQIIFHGPFQATVPGYFNYKLQNLQLQDYVKELGLRDFKKDVKRITMKKGRFILGQNIPDILKSCNITPEKWTTKSGLLFNRKSFPNGHYYFIANHSGKTIDEFIELSKPAESVLIMDPMNGLTGFAKIEAGKKPQVLLQLKPGQSILLKTFSKKNTSGQSWRYYSEKNSPRIIDSDWQVQFITGGPLLPKTRKINKLESWTEWGDAETRRFAGTARYSTSFNSPARADACLLDLGRVAESAVVYLNGEKVTTLFSHPYSVVLKNLKPTNNQLDIKVTNLAANRIRDLDIRNVPWKIFHDINFVNIDYKSFNASNWPLAESGLIGPVTIQPLAIKQ